MAAALEAEGTPIDREAVYKWRRNGIPPRYWGVIARAASRLRLYGITREALEEDHQVGRSLQAAAKRRRLPTTAAPPVNK